MGLDPEDVKRALADAIASALPGEMVTAWVAVVETIDGDGETALWLEAPAGQKCWRSIGMLHYALNLELGATVRGEE